MSEFNIDSIIQTLRDGNLLPEKTLIDLLLKLMEVLYTESNVLELQSPITICGDIHGQLYDLFELFKVSCENEVIGNTKFLFMGDYVDRGWFSIETFAYLAALKLKYKGQFFLLRGNHECRQVNQAYGFYNEIQFNYGHAGIWTLCNEVFDLLPMAAVIDGDVFSVHGGLSPKIALIESISLLDRQNELPQVGPLCDLCWSDPEEVEHWHENQRGAGYLFGGPQTTEFCHLNNIKLITRSHQIAMEGYQKFFGDQLITVWSAPNYMYRSGNLASVMKYKGRDQQYELAIFGPCPNDKRKIPEEIPTSNYFL